MIASELAPGTQLDSLGCTGVAASRAIQDKKTHLTSASWGSSSFKFLQPRLARIGETQSWGHPLPRGLRSDGTWDVPKSQRRKFAFPLLRWAEKYGTGELCPASTSPGCRRLVLTQVQAALQGMVQDPKWVQRSQFPLPLPCTPAHLLYAQSQKLSIKGKKSLGFACS